MRTAFALLLTACATLTAPTAGKAAPPQMAAPTQAEVLNAQISALEQQAHAVETARDDAVWGFWLGNSTPADAGTSDPWAGHPALLEDAALTEVRRARALHLPGELDTLEELIVGERVGRAVRDADAEVTSLESSLRFPFEGRDLLYRDLGAALSNERSPARRQALFSASLPAAQQLDAALLHREQVESEALEKLGTSREAFGALLRGTPLPPARAWAEGFLAATEGRWKARLVTGHVGSRGDLPALLKPSANLDAAFPKARIAERGTALLASLGLYGLSQLTLDLTDSPRKQPLPLTVSGVRMSFKPHGGWKDQQALLAELGRALALRHAPKADRRVIETTAALFASLAWNRVWLEEQGLPLALVSQAVELGADALLLSLRRAAASVLSSPEALDRAYALADDPARFRLDVEPLFAGADSLRASSAALALARHLEVQAGEKWWSSPRTAEVLRAFWQSGALPDAVRSYADNGESLLAALGAPAHGGITPSR
jgi:hypothetical protein